MSEASPPLVQEPTYSHPMSGGPGSTFDELHTPPGVQEISPGDQGNTFLELHTAVEEFTNIMSGELDEVSCH